MDKDYTDTNSDIITSLLKENVKTPKFSLKGERFIAKCVKCYDADTIHIVIYLNNTFTRFCCRLLEIDTPEIRSKDTSEKKEAKIARDYLRNLILDKLIVISCQEFDKYGRLLIYIYNLDNLHTSLQTGGDSKETEITSTRCKNSQGYTWENSINHHLIEKGHAYHYYGGKKRQFNDWFKKKLDITN